VTAAKGGEGRSTEVSWQRVNGWLAIPEITRDDEVLMFDPPDVVFVNGGEQIRVADRLSDRPVLEVMRIQRDAKGENIISRYPMRVASPETSPEVSS
jgi:hypothetical protein